jgi:hypothetical protein
MSACASLIFLSKLPQFDDDTFNGKEVARRITDGTVFMAPASQYLYEDGLLTVYWHSFSNYRSAY